MHVCKGVTTALVCASSVTAALHTAIRSDHFVEHLGVVTHFGYLDTPYGMRHNDCRTLLKELGIRYIRDGVDQNKSNQDIYDTCRIRMLMVSSASNSSLWDTTLASTWMQSLDTYNPSSVLAIEGTNEYNGSNRATWVQELRDFTIRLSARVRSDSHYKNCPIVGPTLSAGYYSNAGDLSPYVDFGGLHWYSAGYEPSNGEFNYFSWHLDNCRQYMYPGKKIWLTETGYHNALTTSWGVSEATAAKYLPRSFMWFLYYKGVERVFSYELLDEWPDSARSDPEKNWGLVRNDLSKKPVFTAVKNCITLLRDPDTSFAPVPLDFTFSGDTSNVDYVLFQKKSGVYMLVIWQEVRSWDVTADQVIAVAPKTVTLTLTTNATIKRYTPTDSSTVNNGTTALSTVTDVNQVSLGVPDNLLFVEINTGAVASEKMPVHDANRSMQLQLVGDEVHMTGVDMRTFSRAGTITLYDSFGRRVAMRRIPIRRQSQLRIPVRAAGWYRLVVERGGDREAVSVFVR